MNKFVKGAKNLAFALSFVTVAACGNVKKGDLEAGLKGLEEKIDSKLKGKADNGTVDENQGYVRKNDIKDFVKNTEVEAVQGEIENLKNGTKFLDSLNNCKDKEILSKLFGSEALNFEAFKGFDYKLIFANNGTNFALEVSIEGKKSEELSVADGDFSGVEKVDGFKVCKNLGFEEKCFVVNGSNKLSVAAGTKAANLKVGGADVALDVAGKILEKAKKLGVDVKKLFEVGDFKDKKLFGVNVSDIARTEVEKVIKVIADGVEEEDGFVSSDTSIKFKFNGVNCELTVANS